MAGLFSTIRSVSTALSAQTQGISVTSNNIANVDNPNYSRETIAYHDLASVPTPDGLQSTGIETSVSQTRNAVLDQLVRQQAALTAGYKAAQTVLQQAQAGLGESITSGSTTSTNSSASTTTSGLSAALSDFFNAVQNLAANPTDAGARQTLIQQAQVVTDRFSTADQNLGQVQGNADAQATSDVATANGLLAQIAQLNSQIASAEVGAPGSAVNLRDQREGSLEQLSALLPVSVSEDARGEDQISTTDTSGHSVVLVNNGVVSNPLSYASGVVSAGTSSPTQLGLATGSIAGTLAASSGAVSTLRSGLDALASQLVTAINGAYNPSATPGGNFFAASGTTAGTIAVDPSLSTANLKAGVGAAGDNSIATAMAGVASQVYSVAGGDAVNGTVTQAYATAVSNLGQALDTANTQADDQASVQTLIVNQRQSSSGVSVDEEMSNLMTYQRAYQASAQVLSVIDSMLSTFFADLANL